jgi:DNA-binding NtrC family response regulator
MAEGTILLVEDDKLVRLALEAEMQEEGYTVLTAPDALSGLKLECLKDAGVDVVITDLRLPGMDGITFLKEIKKLCPDTQVIVITAYGSVESAVIAMREGASDYLCKPFQYEELSLKLARLMEFRARLQEISHLRRQLEERHYFHNLVGKSAGMRRVFELIETVASDSCAVLIQGETGTGKELVAKALHYSSTRRGKPFVAVNCAALSREVIESELFGHELGAFTGAVRRHRGRFELADGGTLFLDDIDDIPLDIQVKLLRTLEEKEFERIGGEKSLAVDVRIISATKQSLGDMVQAGRFRQDLYYRLRVMAIPLPPLRQRREDIPLFIEHFLRQACTARQIPVKHMHLDALRLLLDYDWPGNVRELENVLEQAVLLSPGEEIDVQALPRDIQTREPSHEVVQLHLAGKERLDLPQIMRTVEGRLVQWALAKAGGNQGRAAELVGIPRTTLRHRLEKEGWNGRQGQEP